MKRKGDRATFLSAKGHHENSKGHHEDPKGHHEDPKGPHGNPEGPHDNKLKRPPATAPRPMTSD